MDLGDLFFQIHVIYMCMQDRIISRLAFKWLAYCQKESEMLTPKVLAGVALVASSDSEMTLGHAERRNLDIVSHGATPAEF